MICGQGSWKRARAGRELIRSQDSLTKIPRAEGKPPSDPERGTRERCVVRRRGGREAESTKEELQLRVRPVSISAPFFALTFLLATVVFLDTVQLASISMFSRLRGLLRPQGIDEEPVEGGYEPIGGGDESPSPLPVGRRTEDDRTVYWCFWGLGAGVLLSWNGQ